MNHHHIPAKQWRPPGYDDVVVYRDSSHYLGFKLLTPIFLGLIPPALDARRSTSFLGPVPTLGIKGSVVKSAFPSPY